jgi:hypothetical protein
MALVASTATLIIALTLITGMLDRSLGAANSSSTTFTPTKREMAEAMWVQLPMTVAVSMLSPGIEAEAAPTAEDIPANLQTSLG